MAELCENAVDFSSCPDRDSIRLVVLREIAHLDLPLPAHSIMESSPVIVGGAACSQSKPRRDRPCCFGVPLQQVQHTTCVELFPGCCELVPRPVVKMIDYLSNHLNKEGLFRKTGSLIRQKELRGILCSPEPLPNDSNVHDVANLLKLYLRELPECLLSKDWLPSFIEVARRYRKEPEKLSEHVLDLCLLLPTNSLNMLRYIISFFHHVADCANQNLMDVDNLAVVITPNIIPSHVSSISSDALSLHTSVVRCLIDKAPQLGRVSMRRSNEALKLPGAMGSCRRKQPLRRAKLKPWSSLDCLEDHERKLVRGNDAVGKRPASNRMTTIFSSIGQTISRLTPKNRRFADSPDTSQSAEAAGGRHTRARRHSADDILSTYRDERMTLLTQQTKPPTVCVQSAEGGTEETRHSAIASSKRKREDPEENTPPRKRSFNSPGGRNTDTSCLRAQQDDEPLLAGYGGDEDSKDSDQLSCGLLTPLPRRSNRASRVSLLAMQGAKEESLAEADLFGKDNLKQRLHGLRRSVRRNVKSSQPSRVKAHKRESHPPSSSTSVGSRLATAGTKPEFKEWPVYI